MCSKKILSLATSSIPRTQEPHLTKMATPKCGTVPLITSVITQIIATVSIGTRSQPISAAPARHGSPKVAISLSLMRPTLTPTQRPTPTRLSLLPLHPLLALLLTMFRPFSPRPSAYCPTRIPTTLLRISLLTPSIPSAIDGYATGTSRSLTSIGSSLPCIGFSSLCVRGLLSFLYFSFFPFALPVAPFCHLASQGSFLAPAELLRIPPFPQVPPPSPSAMPSLTLPQCHYLQSAFPFNGPDLRPNMLLRILSAPVPARRHSYPYSPSYLWPHRLFTRYLVPTTP
jgi:hypothetical protein